MAGGMSELAIIFTFYPSSQVELTKKRVKMFAVHVLWQNFAYSVCGVHIFVPHSSLFCSNCMVMRQSKGW